MTEQNRDDEQSIGHDSTTAPGGNKDRGAGDPGRTPDTAEGSRETVEEDLRDKGIE